MKQKVMNKVMNLKVMKSEPAASKPFQPPARWRSCAAPVAGLFRPVATGPPLGDEQGLPFIERKKENQRRSFNP